MCIPSSRECVRNRWDPSVKQCKSGLTMLESAALHRVVLWGWVYSAHVSNKVTMRGDGSVFSPSEVMLKSAVLQNPNVFGERMAFWRMSLGRSVLERRTTACFLAFLGVGSMGLKHWGSLAVTVIWTAKLFELGMAEVWTWHVLIPSKCPIPHSLCGSRKFSFWFKTRVTLCFCENTWKILFSFHWRRKMGFETLTVALKWNCLLLISSSYQATSTKPTLSVLESALAIFLAGYISIWNAFVYVL